MSETDKIKEQPIGKTCNCNSADCCQPKPSRNWQKFVFLAVVLLATGIIAFKFFYDSPKAPACNSKECCADTTQCSGNTKCTDTTQTYDLK